MMSGAKKRVPKRRFKEFLNAGEWEQRKLGEIADITKLAGFEFTKYIVYSDKGNIIALRGLNIKDGDLNLEDVKYIDNSDFTKLKRSKLFRNDILFTYVGTIGEVARIQEDDKYYLAPNVSRIRIKNRLLSEFLMYYMDRDLFYQKIIFPLIATSSQPALSMANIREFNITYPSGINEQQKIALIFSRISHLITLHQRKLDKLQATKKALLQEMFPEEGQDKPKRRFKGFTDAWEQRKLGECMSSFAYGLNAAAKDYDGMHKYIRITDIDDETHNFIQSNLTSPDIDFNMDVSDYKLNIGDIVFARTGASVGKTYLYNPNDGDLYYAGFLIRGKVKEDYDAGFIYQNTLTKEYDSFIRITSQRSGQPGVNSKEYATFRLNIPCKDEQEKISKVLNNLDELFTLHQRKLDKLKNLKQAYLNEMFV